MVAQSNGKTESERRNALRTLSGEEMKVGNKQEKVVIIWSESQLKGIHIYHWKEHTEVHLNLKGWNVTTKYNEMHIFPKRK